MRAATIFLIALAATSLSLIGAPIASSEGLPQKTATGGDSGWVSLGGYEAREPETLDEVPAEIRSKLREHVLARVGERYHSRLEFHGGQIVDIDEMHRLYPKTRNFRWTVFTYRLIFRIDAADAGFDFFCAIELDAKGNVIRDIGLPPVRRLPSKAQFISLSRAYAIASKYGFDPTKTRARLNYRSDVESIVFQLSQVQSRAPTVERVISIDAHNGSFLGLNHIDFYH